MMKKFNKKHLLIAVSCLVVLAVMVAFTALIAIPSIKNAAVKSAKESLFENYYSFPESGLITASNGFKDNKKNSLLYVKSALEHDADCIELDVCFDDEAVAYIAESADAITENTMPFEYLISYLSEEAAKENTRRHFVNFRLCDATNLEELDRIITNYEMEDYCFFTGVNKNQAKYVRTHCNIDFYLDYEVDKTKVNDADYISSVAAEVSQAGAIGINCDFNAFSPLFSSIFKENWLKISFYGVEDELDALKAVQYSPNQIIAEKPELVRAILTEWNANAPSSDIITS
ncbi:MAG: hypothetical protein IJ279_00315 [Clostridia bacterium]|nr:hypothetical protein [Clostridia bacterium]